jgi:hypothetical protein
MCTMMRRPTRPLADAIDPQYEVPTWKRVASGVGAALAVYHGYKRNHESLGWGIAWGALGALFPLITVPVALAQGFGEEKD